MAEHELGAGAEILRKGHEAFNQRDRDGLLRAMTEDVRWHTDGNNPMAGTHEGRDAVWEHFFAPQWDAPVRVEDHDILDNGEHAVALLDIVVGSGEDERSWKTAEVVHLRDGLIAERWAFTERQAELDEIARQAAE